MLEAYAIKFATLHLEGLAHELWYHGLITLGHFDITSYMEFTQIMIAQFNRKDPNIQFREVAQLKWTEAPKSYIS